MSILYNKEDRQVIPRLRTFDLTMSTGELSSPETSHNLTNSSLYHLKLRDKWLQNKTIIIARKLYSSAMILGIENQYTEVGDFILKNGNEKDRITEFIKSKLDFNPIIKNEFDNRIEIQNLKENLKENPKNPILWSELSRFYLLENQSDKAVKCAEISISLDKDNRYVLRTMSSLFNQLGDTERALKTIRLSGYHKLDPWLLSADLAFSNLLKRKSKLIDHSIKVLNSYKDKPNYITELLSSVGAYEFKHGSIKKVNKYLIASLIEPTDNSLAQALWLSDKNIVNQYSWNDGIDNIKLNFEAKTLNFFNAEKFENAYLEAINWYNDEPYSMKALTIASYIDSVFLKKYEKSIKIMKKVLDKGFSDDLSVNNLIYMLLKSGNYTEAEKYHQKYFPKLLEEANNPIYIATTGMLSFRLGRLEQGHKLYQEAINLARKTKHNKNLLRAMGNYLVESHLVNYSGEETEKIRKEFVEKASKSEESEIKQILTDYRLLNENTV